MYRIFGSFEIFGNPSNFIGEIKKGVSNFLIVPFRELKEKKNLKNFGMKIMHGTKSFALSIVVGIFNVITSIVDSIMRSIDFLTLDRRFRYLRQKLRDSGISGLFDGFVLGLKSLYLGRVEMIKRFQIPSRASTSSPETSTERRVCSAVSYTVQLGFSAARFSNRHWESTICSTVH